MDLLSNPFFLLNASVRDDSRRLIELSEKRSLFVNPQKCNEARIILTNPRQRLMAEIAWLPGVSPSKARNLINQAREGHYFLFETIEGLSALSACNLLALSISFVKVEEVDESGIKNCIQMLIKKFEAVDIEDLLHLINEDRGVAGFPAVQSEDIITQALVEHRGFLVTTLIEWLDKLNEPDLALTEVATELTKNGEYQAPLLLEELTAKYQIEVAQHLNQLKEHILKLKGSIEKLLTNNERPDNLLTHINRLEQLLRQWDRIAKPIQLIAKTRGIDEEASTNLAAQVRNLSIFLANSFSHHEYALRLSLLMAELFSEIPQLSAHVEEDIITLQGILENKERVNAETRVEKEKWEQEIALDIMIGKDKLTIDAENLTYLGPGWRYSVRTDEVDRVRWGVFKQYTNALRTGRYFTFWVGSPKRTIEIECVRFLESESTVRKRYEIILEKLWKAVCGRLVGQTLSRLSSGEKLRYGNVVVDKEGVLLPKYKFLGLSSEPVHYPWEELTISSGAGYFKISAAKEKNYYAQLSYRDIDNVHILEAIMRFLWKDGNYIKLRNGEFQ